MPVPGAGDNCFRRPCVERHHGMIVGRKGEIICKLGLTNLMGGAASLGVASGRIAKDEFFAHAHEMMAEWMGSAVLAKA